MRFLHGWKRDRTCELNFQEKGSRYVDIISVYFSGRTGDGSHLPKVKAAKDHWYACNGYRIRPVCFGSVRSINFGSLIGSAQDGFDHYFVEGRTVIRSGGS